MSTSKLFIPKKLKVGFQKRIGTYTGQLAYVIYYDEKNKLRKETSFEAWRDKNIDCIELDNKPQSGFVLNKGVGGARQSYGWNTRNEYIRVYDPRNVGFEFEISVSNLLFILRECDCSKGKGLEGEFVYAWDGKELVLLPVSSEDYKKSTEFTSLKEMSINSKNLIKGASYLSKDMDTYIYIGKLRYNSYCYKSDYIVSSTNEHIFYDPGNKSYHAFKLNKFGKVVDETPVNNYSKLLQKYLTSNKHKKISKISLKYNDNYSYYGSNYYKSKDGSKIFILFRNNYDNSKFSYYSYGRKIESYDLKEVLIDKNGSILKSKELINVKSLDDYVICEKQLIVLHFDDNTFDDIRNI